jgi:hypothetical protein
MIRLLIRAAIHWGSAALGILIAALALHGFHLGVAGFFTTVVVFTIAQSILGPFIFTMAHRYAPALLGGVGAWVLATLIIWVVNALGGWLLPRIFLKKAVTRDRSPGTPIAAWAAPFPGSLYIGTQPFSHVPIYRGDGRRRWRVEPGPCPGRWPAVAW